MEAIKDLWNSIRLNLLDRIGNPLVGAFALAWCVWNFRLILIAFGEGGWQSKIEYIDNRLMPNWSDWFVHGYLVPILFALAWVFVFPFVFRRVMVFHREQAAETAKAVMIADGTQPISAEEANQLRLRIRALGDEWSQERAIYLKQNDELSQRIASLTEKESKLSQLSTGSVQASHVTSSEPSSASENPDPLLSTVADLKENGGVSVWPIQLSGRDIQQLPSGLATKVRGHRFQHDEVLALVAMRNWPRVEKMQLARALKIEPFDAQFILDRLRNIGLLSQGVEGTFINADGRMLTSFFKRIIDDSSRSPQKLSDEKA